MSLQIRMLGRFEVLLQGGQAASLRSRKVGALAAFLALHKGRSVSNHTLQDLLWPDSDGDRQSQSFRRAISDLRDAFEGETGRRDVVQTDHGSVSLAPENFETDLERFESLLADPESADFDLRAAEALALYGGPLLATLDDDWVFAYRRQYEEVYCGAVERLCRLLAARGQGREAVRIANTAIVLAPLREEPYVASILSYAVMGNRAMALRQYEALEKMLDDDFGQTPSEAALAALDEPTGALHGGAPRPIESPPVVVPLDTESRFYIDREADNQVDSALDALESVVLVFGPRQVGKTSLLARSSARLRQKGHKVVVTDFQSLSKSEVERSITLYRALVHSLASQLGLDYEPSWNEWIGANSNLDALVDGLLKRTEGPVCWAMDEVDRVFGTEYADDFFGLVRSWHNRRALSPDGPWKRLSILISYATEAHLFITDLNQSPFNVGVRVSLRDFTLAEVLELGKRYQSSFETLGSQVFEVTLGHPYLTRRAFSFLHGNRTIEELRELSPSESGPFGDHLKHVFGVVSKEADILDEVRRFLRGDPFDSLQRAERLQAAGLITMSPDHPPSFRVPAYGIYLMSKLT